MPPPCRCCHAATAESRAECPACREPGHRACFLAGRADPRDAAGGWPLGERAVGALARAAAVTVGALPALLGGALHEGARALVFLPVVAVFAVAAFALERRDATATGTAWRLAAAAILGAVLAPFAAVWCAHAGDPEGALRAIERIAHDVGRAAERTGLVRGVGLAAITSLGLAIVANLAGLLLHVRRVTDERLPQLLGGLLPAGVAGLLVLNGVGAGLGLGLAISGLLAPLLLERVEACTRRLDPSFPGPRAAPAVPVFVGWILGALAGGGVSPAVIGALIPPRRSSLERYAIGALKTLNSAQTLYREGDKDGDGTLDYAGSLAELSDATLIDGVLGEGLKAGYVFRLIRSAPHGEYLWAAAADPVVPGTTGHRYFATNHAGVIYYTTSGPIPLDPIGCGMPPNVRPVGR